MRHLPNSATILCASIERDCYRERVSVYYCYFFVSTCAKLSQKRKNRTISLRSWNFNVLRVISADRPIFSSRIARTSGRIRIFPRVENTAAKTACRINVTESETYDDTFAR